MSRPRRRTGSAWRCLWAGCPDQGRTFTAPAGVSALRDGQEHHRTVHGVKPYDPDKCTLCAAIGHRCAPCVRFLGRQGPR